MEAAQTGVGFWPALLAFGVAGLITAIELITSKYPRTFFLLRPSTALYGYALAYAAIAFGVALALDALGVALDGIGMENPWVRAVAVGISIKALMHIRLFNVTTGPGKSFPFGIESIVQLFEPWLLRTVELDHFNGLREYIAPFAARHTDLPKVQQMILSNVPNDFSADEKAVLSNDVGKASDVGTAMEVYLVYVGRRTFERVFA